MTQATPLPKKRKRSFFYSGREDSPFKRLMIHAALWFACLIAIYPILRIISVSLRPGNTLLSTDLALIPDGATLESYRIMLFDKPFLSWLWNSLMITVATSVRRVILAATSAYAFSRHKFPGRSVGLVFLLTTQIIPAAMMIVPI